MDRLDCNRNFDCFVGAGIAAEFAAGYMLEVLQKEEKKGNTFSFMRFLNGAASRHLDGLEAEMAEEGRKEYARNGFAPKGEVIPSAVFMRTASGQKAGAAADGGNLVITGQRHKALRVLDVLLAQQVDVAAVAVNHDG